VATFPLSFASSTGRQYVPATRPTFAGRVLSPPYPPSAAAWVSSRHNALLRDITGALGKAGTALETATIVHEEEGQTIQLPVAYRFVGERLCKGRVGSAVVLPPYDAPYSAPRAHLDEFTE